MTTSQVPEPETCRSFEEAEGQRFNSVLTHENVVGIRCRACGRHVDQDRPRQLAAAGTEGRSHWCENHGPYIKGSRCSHVLKTIGSYASI